MLFGNEKKDRRDATLDDHANYGYMIAVLDSTVAMLDRPCEDGTVDIIFYPHDIPILRAALERYRDAIYEGEIPYSQQFSDVGRLPATVVKD